MFIDKIKNKDGKIPSKVFLCILATICFLISALITLAIFGINNDNKEFIENSIPIDATINDVQTKVSITNKSNKNYDCYRIKVYQEIKYSYIVENNIYDGSKIDSVVYEKTYNHKPSEETILEDASINNSLYKVGDTLELYVQKSHPEIKKGRQTLDNHSFNKMAMPIITLAIILFICGVLCIKAFTIYLRNERFKKDNMKNTQKIVFRRTLKRKNILVFPKTLIDIIQIAFNECDDSQIEYKLPFLYNGKTYTISLDYNRQLAPQDRFDEKYVSYSLNNEHFYTLEDLYNNATLEGKRFNEYTDEFELDSAFEDTINKQSLMNTNWRYK